MFSGGGICRFDGALEKAIAVRVDGLEFQGNGTYSLVMMMDLNKRSSALGWTMGAIGRGRA